MYKTAFPGEGNRNQVGDLLYGLIIQKTIKQANFTCQNTATLTPTTPLSNRKFLKIFNNSGNIIYYGDSSVTTTNGMPIYPHSWDIIQIEDGINIYTISAAGGEDLRICEGS